MRITFAVQIENNCWHLASIYNISLREFKLNFGPSQVPISHPTIGPPAHLVTGPGVLVAPGEEGGHNISPASLSPLHEEIFIIKRAVNRRGVIRTGCSGCSGLCILIFISVQLQTYITIIVSEY